VSLLSTSKFRNAGQVCTAPTRILVQESVYDQFVEKFVAVARLLKVGDGMNPESRMGPVANERRLEALEAFVADAQSRGARIRTGGARVGNRGYFFEPTVLTDVPREARLMNDEPFGPLAAITSFDSFDRAVAEANRLRYGLAAYAFTRSTRTAAAIGAAIESGMVAINSATFALAETPFGGVKDSGYGTEGGREALDSYLNTKYIAQAAG
jgi:succinate-semialdehyde dehydrogenase/glutarate-semialdehyde dehydrogenase